MQAVVDGRPTVVAETAHGLAATDYADMISLIRDGSAGLERASAAAATAPEVGAIVTPDRTLAPLRPGRMFYGGVNFESHRADYDGEFPSRPFFFSKLPSAVVGPDEPIVLPYRNMRVDYEVELAVVIGTSTYAVSQEEALDRVFGYTVTNDLGARSIDDVDLQLALSKNSPSFAPLGPVIVTADEIPDPSTLHIESTVNGKPRQSESLATMWWDVPTLLAWLSTVIDLQPGDVMAVGTPGGNGGYRTPPEWLEPGDLVTVSERTIGELANSVFAGPSYDEDWSDVAARFAHRSPSVREGAASGAAE